MKWLSELIDRKPRVDEPAVLEGAMFLFWEKGFFRTTDEELESATSTTQKELYRYFGDKKGLFIATIEHYLSTKFADLMFEMERQTNPQKSIDIALDFFRKNALAPETPGCFLANSIVELGDDPKVKKLFDRAVSVFTSIVTSKLVQIPARFNQVTADQAAATITNSLIGLAVASRSNAGPQNVELIFAGLGQLLKR